MQISKGNTFSLSCESWLELGSQADTRKKTQEKIIVQLNPALQNQIRTIYLDTNN